MAFLWFSSIGLSWSGFFVLSLNWVKIGWLMTESIRQVCGVRVCEHQAGWTLVLELPCAPCVACGLEHQNLFSTCEGPGSPRRRWCCLCCCGALVLYIAGSMLVWGDVSMEGHPDKTRGTWLPLAVSHLTVCSGIIFLSLISHSVLSCLTHFCPHISVVVSIVPFSDLMFFSEFQLIFGVVYIPVIIAWPQEPGWHKVSVWFLPPLWKD